VTPREARARFVARFSIAHAFALRAWRGRVVGMSYASRVRDGGDLYCVRLDSRVGPRMWVGVDASGVARSVAYDPEKRRQR
jgi:hypothetical protein